MIEPKIFYQPTKLRWDLRLADHPLSTYTPLNDAAAAAARTDAKVGDLTPDDHVVVYFSSRHFIPYWGVDCAISLMIARAQGIKPRHYFTLPFFYWNFKHILTHSTKYSEGARTPSSSTLISARRLQATFQRHATYP